MKKSYIISNEKIVNANGFACPIGFKISRIESKVTYLDVVQKEMDFIIQVFNYYSRQVPVKYMSAMLSKLNYIPRMHSVTTNYIMETVHNPIYYNFIEEDILEKILYKIDVERTEEIPTPIVEILEES